MVLVMKCKYCGYEPKGYEDLKLYLEFKMFGEWICPRCLRFNNKWELG